MLSSAVDRLTRPLARGWRRCRDHPRCRWLGRHAGDLLREAKEDRVTGLAAEVAFFVVLSVFPALMVMASALGFLDSIVGNRAADDAQAAVVDFLERVLTESASGTIDVVRSVFTEQQGGLLTFGVLTGLWATARGFAAVIRALNVAYDIEEDRGWFRRQAVAVLLSLGTVAVAAVMVTMLVVGPLLGAAGSVASAVGLEGLFSTAWAWLRFPLVLALLVAWSATVFHVGPTHRGPWTDDLPGAGLTALWWAVTTVGFGQGVTLLSQGNRVFGILGGPLILLGLIYVLGLGLLLGGELNAHVVHQRRQAGPGAEVGPGG